MKLFSESVGSVKTNEELKLLQQRHTDLDPAFICQAAHLSRRGEKRWLESVWRQYKPYADPHFCGDFKRQFKQRSWELYLGVALLNRGFKLRENRGTGPDFEVRAKDGGQGQCIVWIEAVVPTMGKGKDRVPEVVDGELVDFPEEELRFRLASSLKEKFDRYGEYLQKGIVKASDPYVIAVNRSGLGLQVDPVVPMVLKVLFGIGHPVLRFPVGAESPPAPEAAWTTQYKISKRSGATVSMLFFMSQEHAGISAVIYCLDSILNSPRLPHEMGENFVVVHNPLAKNPLPVGFFHFGDEWRVMGENLEKIRARKNYTRP